MMNWLEMNWFLEKDVINYGIYLRRMLFFGFYRDNFFYSWSVDMVVMVVNIVLRILIIGFKKLCWKLDFYINLEVIWGI